MNFLKQTRKKPENCLLCIIIRLVVYIAKKFESTGTGIEDLISIGSIGLIKAVNTFCPDKNIKLATMLTVHRKRDTYVSEKIKSV